MKPKAGIDLRAIFVRGALLTASLFALAGAALADGPALAVVRLSYVAGEVQVTQADGAVIDHAVENMPLIEGATIATAADGQAEVEFTDGSVARLTPNSSLQITRLMRAPNGGNSVAPPHTDITLLSGLGYFELNTSRSQMFTLTAAGVHMHANNAIFRVALDGTPELAVFQGSVVKFSGPGDRARVGAYQSLHLDDADNQIAQGFPADSWDQWDLDRDNAIAEEASAQTDVRDSAQNASDPGWNDLDANGSWYSVDGYGNVWTPSGVGADWDPFGDGYWGEYPGYGVVWISGYPWGWLPYHCGAWNYFSFGWGWVPGDCGVWSPVVTVWNLPPNYRLPVAPGLNPHLGIVPSQHRAPITGRLVPVRRGVPSAPTAAANVAGVNYNGRILEPKPLQRNTASAMQGRIHVGVPARIGAVSTAAYDGTAVAGTGRRVAGYGAVPGPLASASTSSSTAGNGRPEINRHVQIDPDAEGPQGTGVRTDTGDDPPGRVSEVGPGSASGLESGVRSTEPRPVGRAGYTPAPGSSVPRPATPPAPHVPSPPHVPVPAVPAPHISAPAAPVSVSHAH